jgi:CBS domain-containing protein
MKAVNKGYVCITNADGSLAGIFTEREVINHVAGQIQDLSRVPIETLMTTQPTALPPTAPLAHGLHLMAIDGFRHVPLVDGAGRPKGILTFRRVLEFIEEIA